MNVNLQLSIKYFYQFFSSTEGMIISNMMVVCRIVRTESFGKYIPFHLPQFFSRNWPVFEFLKEEMFIWISAPTIFWWRFVEFVMLNRRMSNEESYLDYKFQSMNLTFCLITSMNLLISSVLWDPYWSPFSASLIYK